MLKEGVGFPGGSVVKNSPANAGDIRDVGWRIPWTVYSMGSQRIRHDWMTFTFTWASLIAQLVRNLPAMQETPVQFLDQEDLLEKGWAMHSSIPGLPLWLSW